MIYSSDDLKIGQSYPTQNIDFLDEPNDYLNTSSNLQMTIKNCKDNSALSIRLRNACWRRIHQNLHNTERCSPSIINWNKVEDITWLYGARFIANEWIASDKVEETYFDEISIDDEVETDDYNNLGYDSSCASSIISACDDTSSLSSYDSGYVTDYPKQRTIPISQPKRRVNFYGDEEECIYQKKSNMRTSGGNLKKVSLNYIISVREIINGRVCDYDFLEDV